MIQPNLAYMRRRQRAAMPDTCTLRTVATVSDGSGGYTEGTTDVINVPCRIRYSGGSETTRANQTTPERVYVLTVPMDYTLTPAMRVISRAGVTFSVVDVNEGISWATANRATLQRVES